jgi:hypothetical protein
MLALQQLRLSCFVQLIHTTKVSELLGNDADRMGGGYYMLHWCSGRRLFWREGYGSIGHGRI